MRAYYDLIGSAKLQNRESFWLIARNSFNRRYDIRFRLTKAVVLTALLSQLSEIVSFPANNDADFNNFPPFAKSPRGSILMI